MLLTCTLGDIIYFRNRVGSWVGNLNGPSVTNIIITVLQYYEFNIWNKKFIILYLQSTKTTIILISQSTTLKPKYPNRYIPTILTLQPEYANFTKIPKEMSQKYSKVRQ